VAVEVVDAADADTGMSQSGPFDTNKAEKLQ
jgi:hypothetical protein